jgi:UDP-N-acetylglucosamine--N-acetylmuramyl-(pentapeptide) pyrophosphoryl-undecaprenol N-acetylglucosamine transferase
VPSPNVTENHQYHNAMALVENDAAVMIEEKDLTGERLRQEVDNLLSNPKKMVKIGANAKKMAVCDATQRILDCIVMLADKNK